MPALSPFKIVGFDERLQSSFVKEWVHELDPELLKIFGIARGDGEVVDARDRGDHGVDE